jgi:hypothetical protein
VLGNIKGGLCMKNKKAIVVVSVIVGLAAIYGILVLRKIEKVYGVSYNQLIFLPLDFGKTE